MAIAICIAPVSRWMITAEDQKIAAFGSSYTGFAFILQELPKAAIF